MKLEQIKELKRDFLGMREKNRNEVISIMNKSLDDKAMLKALSFDLASDYYNSMSDFIWDILSKLEVEASIAEMDKDFEYTINDDDDND